MPPEKIQLLIVDDELHARFIIKSMFSIYNVDVLEARDGDEALEILKKEKVDLVILDNNMPIISGKEVINWMLLDNRMKDIPVIVYTAGVFDEEHEKQLMQSSAAFILKSSLGDDLIPTVQQILGPRLKKN